MDQDYLCEGVAEEIINALTQIKEFFVVARGSAFSFRGKDVGAREIGRRLNVDTILEGSIQRVADRLRLTVQLVDAGKYDLGYCNFASAMVARDKGMSIKAIAGGRAA